MAMPMAECSGPGVVRRLHSHTVRSESDLTASRLPPSNLTPTVQYEAFGLGRGDPKHFDSLVIS